MKKQKWPWAVLAIALCLIGAGGWSWWNQLGRTFPPHTVIDGVDVSGLTLDKAHQALAALPQPKGTVFVTAGSVTIASDSAQLGVRKDVATTVQQAWRDTTAADTPTPSTTFSFAALRAALRSRIHQTAQRLSMVFHPNLAHSYTTPISFDSEKTRALLTTLKQRTDQPGTSPSAQLATSGNANSLTIKPGTLGHELNIDATLMQIQQHLDQQQASTSAVIAETSTVLSPAQIASATARAKLFVGARMLFQRQGKPDLQINDQQLLSFLRLPSGFNDDALDKALQAWQKTVNSPAQEPVFTYDKQTLKVSQFTPPRDGQTLDLAATKQEIIQSLSDLDAQTTASRKTYTFTLPVTTTPPTKSLGSTNDLGITERIGFGDSEYEHSIPNRIFNVSLTADRISNTIVAPGAEFSFNKTLGEVSGATGFKPAYVIQGNRTVLGDGGGVCQVSTTVFRAILNAGLKVTRRYAHSYRVSYYELNALPGIDATVYAGDVDLRFVNDTDHNILIHTETYPQNVYMTVEIYGTSDGRTTQIVDHKTWDPIPAPPALYQDDPTLPKGTTKQVDFSASGIKASFVNVIKDKSGKVLRQDTYFSNYRPWQAIYMVGTG